MNLKTIQFQTETLQGSPLFFTQNFLEIKSRV